MGSDESHFNVLFIVRDKVTVSTNHNLFEEKGEPKRNRAEVLLLTSLTPYRWAKPAQSGFNLTDSVLLYVHINHEAYQGRGAQDGHLDFHTAPEICWF